MVRRAVKWSWIAGAVLLVAGTGFSTPLLFAEPVHVGGGGGRFFTGSPRDAFGCEVCHRGAEGPRIDVDGLGDAYAPGLTFTLSMRWPMEARDVGLIGEIVNADGIGVGTFVTPPDELVEDAERCAGGNLATRVVDDASGERTLFGVPACGASALRLQWTAPEEDVGPVFVHVGAVGSDASDDPEGDGVWMWAQELSSPSGDAEPEGCRIGGASAPASWCPMLLVLLGGLTKRLRARRRRCLPGMRRRR